MNRAKDDQPVAKLSLFVSNAYTVIKREFTYSKPVMTPWWPNKWLIKRSNGMTS